MKLPSNFKWMLLIAMMGHPPSIMADETSIHIRTLASSCFICHGAPSNVDSNAVIPSLAGLDEAYFIKKMQAFRASIDQNTVMVQHAKGLTEDEITLLAGYFAEQRRACPITKSKPGSWSYE